MIFPQIVILSRAQYDALVSGKENAEEALAAKLEEINNEVSGDKEVSASIRDKDDDRDKDEGDSGLLTSGSKYTFMNYTTTGSYMNYTGPGLMPIVELPEGAPEHRKLIELMQVFELPTQNWCRADILRTGRAPELITKNYLLPVKRGKMAQRYGGIGSPTPSPITKRSCMGMVITKKSCITNEEQVQVQVPSSCMVKTTEEKEFQYFQALLFKPNAYTNLMHVDARR